MRGLLEEGASLVEIPGVHGLVVGVLKQHLADPVHPEQHQRSELRRVGTETFAGDPLQRSVLWGALLEERRHHRRVSVVEVDGLAIQGAHAAKCAASPAALQPELKVVG